MQLFIKFRNNYEVYDVDGALTICQLKNLLDLKLEKVFKNYERARYNQ